MKNVVYAAKVTVLNNNNEARNILNVTPNQNNVTTEGARTRSSTRQSQPTRTQDANPDISADNPTPPNNMTYIGAAENFKTRYRNHIKSFNNIRYEKDTELSKFIWNLKLNNKKYSIKWNIIKKSAGYNQRTKLCNLCTSEKLEIIKFKEKNNLLNKRNELVSKCRHENKFSLANLPDP